MSKEFKLSDPGEGLQEAEISEVHVSKGDHVDDGDIILTVETDKANTDVPAPFTGTIEKVHVKQGDVAQVGDVLITYTEEGAEEETSEQEQEETEASAEDTEEREPREEKTEKGEETEAPRDEDKEEEKEQEEEQEQEAPAASEEKTRHRESEEEQPEESREAATGESDREGPIPAAPSTRRLAREKGVDLRQVKPSGPEGRVTAEDVEAAARSGDEPRRRRPGSTALTPGVSPVPLPDFSRWGEVERVPLRSIRRATAQRMARSWSQIPHVFHQDIADITELDRFRHEYEDSAEAKGGKFTLTVLMMKALVYALKEHPRFNASLDVENEEIVLKRYFHIGMAVATDRGLLVPVIRDVDSKSLTELTEEVTEMAEKTRNGEVSREDMQGGTMTLTNPGSMGGSAISPLINYPQVAILGLGQVRLEPVVRGDLQSYKVVPRLRLPLCLAFDHRVNDGADAAQFVTMLIRILDDPKALLLKI